MSKMLSKHFRLCFFNLKQSPSGDPSTSTTTTTSLFNHDSSDHPSPPPPPDFAAVLTSQRFFFSSPGLSNSIIESPDTRPPTTTHTTSSSPSSVVAGSGVGVGVPKYSVNPYLDFRRSMQEMIESRESVDVREDWDYLHDLLLCYLALNPSHTHRYIVRAFTDLVVDLLSSAVPETTFCRKTRRRRHKSFSCRLV